ncbi:histidine phosphatase family protein [Mycolicibacterium neoaurum]|uniref:histidine phosphatase family protein n=1 Tax=Mycolicibacterium neoaurum TaxID=1795 RepID=UPI00248AD1BE|nr:histidine phosphatase family protein [Mycolicibacterium neoaurum]WBP93964.1 histidine phosphatase family protein [Mycolicibacterium neoaurum]WBS07682.1 histidine phosphatase family protein [Mycolicibacterium neoaurum]
MSEVVRLTLVSHGMTEAMAAGRFPADEPLNALGARQAADLVAVHTGAEPGVLCCAPELRAGQTAQALGGPATIEPALADLDCGRWRGMSLQDVDPAGLASWLTDPTAAPHGGESIAALCDRVRHWLDGVATGGGRHTAVTHPAVIRAVILTALNAAPTSFWRVDIAPAARVTLHFRGAWTLRL